MKLLAKKIFAVYQKSASGISGTIFNVPRAISDDNKEAKTKDQGVIGTRRTKQQVREKTYPTETCILNFDLFLPYQVKLLSMSFYVRPFNPSPLGVRSVTLGTWSRLGHTEAKCSNKKGSCSKYFQHHELNFPTCSTW